MSKVYIVGAGPGDESLITIKARELLSKADIVLYDNLLNPRILSYCKDNAEKIYVGKVAGKHTFPQDEINQMLVKFSKQGKVVIRLKGGDPLIFGRGSEEALYLKESGIDFEIVPGITSASGASAYSGIPLTHRNLVTQSIFVTAHEAPEKDNTQVQWELLAKMKNATIVIYMGAKMLKKIAENLIKNGMDENTPIAIIQNATLPQQKTIASNLKSVLLFSDDYVEPPVISIIGDTAKLHNDLSWFEKKILFGKRIVITRAQDQSNKLYNLLANEGAWVLLLSSIKTEFSAPSALLADLLKNRYDWIIFSSANGVRYFFKELFAEGLDSRSLYGKKIAVIGSATAETLWQYGITADLIPSQYIGKSLIEELSNQILLSNSKILRVKGDFENDYIADSLIQFGADVDLYEVYKIKQGKPDKEVINDIIENGANAVVFTSSSTVVNFFKIIGSNALSVLKEANVISIGPMTTNKLIEYGITHTYTAKEQTVKGIFEKIMEIYSKSAI